MLQNNFRDTVSFQDHLKRFVRMLSRVGNDHEKRNTFIVAVNVDPRQLKYELQHSEIFFDPTQQNMLLRG